MQTKELLKSSCKLLIGGSCTFLTYEIITGNDKFYTNLLMPSLQSIFDAETAHRASVQLISLGIIPIMSNSDDTALKTTVFGKTFQNPIGIAAGFDKHAEAIQGLGKIGFGFVEVGSITPLPQNGNDKPRVFRLNKDQAVINRYGFNSCGHHNAALRLEKYCNDRPRSDIILGVNLGKNKLSATAKDDYVAGVRNLGRFADYIVINVSSPNTPGLRDLQGKEMLSQLCCAVVDEKIRLGLKVPILVKISPDITEKDKADIAEVIMQSKIDGMIVSNATTSRPSSLVSDNKHELGGLSGRPLKHQSSVLIRDMFTLTNGSIPIIGVGGIENGVDAYEKIRAGASLVQLYTSFTYHGPPLVPRIKKELEALLKNDGFLRLSDAVGVDVCLPDRLQTDIPSE